MFIKPAKGIKIRDPQTKQHLPDEGKDVVENSFWIRCLQSGDVVLCDKSGKAIKDKEVN